MANSPAAMATEHTGSLRLWGSLETRYLEFDGADGISSDNWRNTGTINASDYIWRPWFATVSGSLGLTVEESETNNQDEVNDEFLTGNLSLGVFPTSRFPFRAYFAENRQEVDTETFESTTRSRQYGLFQQYRPLSGGQNYSASYENEEQTLEDGNNFISEQLSLEADYRMVDHSIDTGLSVDQVENTVLGQQAERNSFVVDHSYEGSRDLSWDNLFSVISNENDIVSSRREFDSSQISSFLSWNPEGRKDLKLTGSLRLNQNETFEEQSDSGIVSETEREIETINLNQGLSYNFSDNLSLGESINASWTEDNGAELFVISESLSANYVGDSRKIDWGSYNWSAGTDYTNRHGDIESQHSMSSRFNHSLSNDFSVRSSYQLRSTLGQGVRYQVASERSDEKRLDHSYALTWSNSRNFSQNTVRLRISDSRELNPENDYFQLLNLQYNGGFPLSRHAQLDGNLTFQLTKAQENGLDSRERFSNGELRYRHARAFDIVGMIFSSKLRLSRRLTDAERVLREGDSDTDVLLENKLSYRIGRLNMEVDLDFIKADSDYDRIFSFRLVRSFGDL